jgi:hypothetical protein
MTRKAISTGAAAAALGLLSVRSFGWPGSRGVLQLTDMAAACGHRVLRVCKDETGVLHTRFVSARGHQRDARPVSLIPVDSYGARRVMAAR